MVWRTWGYYTIQVDLEGYACNIWRRPQDKGEPFRGSGVSCSEKDQKKDEYGLCM